jgi:Bacterial regulatory proteins, luxR family
VLRYLPTNLSAPEIARELSVSPNTVKTHIRHLYAKFGTHHRAEAVDVARAFGLHGRGATVPARFSPCRGAIAAAREHAAARRRRGGDCDLRFRPV